MHTNCPFTIHYVILQRVTLVAINYIHTMCARTRSVPVTHCIPNYLNDSAVYTAVYICIAVLAYHPGDLHKLVYEIIIIIGMISSSGMAEREE